MDENPQAGELPEESDDDLWWVPWHWGQRQWGTAFLVFVVMWFGPAIYLISHMLDYLTS